MPSVIHIGDDLTLALHKDGAATYTTEDGTERDVLVAAMRARIQAKIRVSFLEEWLGKYESEAWDEKAKATQPYLQGGND